MSAAKAVPVVGPVIERTETGLERAEDEMWRQVRHRMDTVAPSDGTVVVSVDHSPALRSNGTNALATVLTDLLVVSTEQSAEDARQRLYASVLNELQPDEARSSRPCPTARATRSCTSSPVCTSARAAPPCSRTRPPSDGPPE
jgi:hypothetical protein